MMRSALCALAVALVACTSPNQGGGGPDGGEDGGTITQSSNWTLSTLTGADDKVALSMAVGPDDRVGIAYFHNAGPSDAGTGSDYEIRYLEWKNGVAGTPESIRTVQRVFGISVAFDTASGQPAVAYLGGDGTTDTGGQSEFWFQSDAAIARRSGSGAWSEEVVVKNSGDAASSVAFSNNGYLVGLNPALAFGAAGAFLAYRDGHYGQFPQQDWAASDLEIAIGQPGSYEKTVVMAGGDDKQAWGGHIHMALAGDGQPGIVSDQAFGAADAPGQNVFFNRRKPDGSWYAPTRPLPSVGNTQSGASIAWDAQLGFAVAVVDRNTNALVFTRSVNEGQTWTDPDPVYQSGSGGWYPSLSVNPLTHDPSIAFYVCSRQPGANEGSCVTADDALRVSERIGPTWQEETVDPAGAYGIALHHLSNGKRVIAYRDPRTGELKLAVEK